MPYIDHELASKLLMEGGEAPAEWPSNWQWLLAMESGRQRLVEVQNEIETLRVREKQLMHSIQIFKSFFDAEKSWLLREEKEEPA